jgi:hypothetical protein
MAFVVLRSLVVAAGLFVISCGPQVDLGDTEAGSSSDAEASTGVQVMPPASSSSTPPGSSTNGPGSATTAAGDTMADGDTTSGASMSTTDDRPVTTGATTDTEGTSTGHVPRCNDGHVDPGEQCDGENLDGWTCEGLGRDGGELACSPASCTFDTEACEPTGRGCGDGMLSPGEQCDGMDLQGFDCESLGLGDGTLGCDPVTCTFDTSMCGA